jgi:eukaryotic translation initiation factor 2C
MEPTLNPDYAFNIRSFFTDKESKDIGNGLVLWRGYFQSIRPAIGCMLINVDISTGVMYKAGNLLELCREFIAHRDPNALAPRRGFPDRERIRLQRFITGIRVFTRNPATGQVDKSKARTVKRLSSAGANDLTFSLREGGQMTVAQYFSKTYKRPLKFPDVLCAEVCQSIHTVTDCLARLVRSAAAPSSPSKCAKYPPARSCANRSHLKKPRTFWTSRRSDPMKG